MKKFFNDTYEGRKPKFSEACLLLIIVCSILIYFNIIIGLSALVALGTCLAVCCCFAAYWGNSWEVIEKMMLDGMRKGLVALILNLLIGMLIAAWCAGGIVPYLIYLGLQIFSPQWIMVTTLILCSIMSCCTGSSWTTAGTVGIAMFSIGTAMGIPPGLMAAPILTGAYFGDKLSPVSESNILACATAETKLPEHISAMFYVAIPAAIISCIIYAIIGWQYSAVSGIDASSLGIIIAGIEEKYWLNPTLLIPIIIMGYLVYKKAPAILVMGVAIILGVLFASFQGVTLLAIGKGLIHGYNAETSVSAVNKMLSKGGINAMKDTVFIIALGLPMGGILKSTHTLETIVFKFKNLVNSRVGVVVATLLTILVMAAVCGDTYASYILTCSAYAAAYDRLQLDRRMLSRSCELGVIMNCIFPWTAGGIFMSSLFGISTLTYAPYYYWGYLIFFMSIVCIATGWGVFYTNGRRGWGKNKVTVKELDAELPARIAINR